MVFTFQSEKCYLKEWCQIVSSNPVSPTHSTRVRCRSNSNL